MEHISITQFRLVKNHPYLKALVDVKIAGLHLRGLRLEEKQRGELDLGFPGRKIQGQWQVVYEAEDRTTRSELLNTLQSVYRQHEEAA